jgi:16S rRNA (guanine527-N7)-methyltransferase
VDFSVPVTAIEQLAGPLSSGQRGVLGAYGRAIQEASGRVNLVSRRSLEALHEHFVDSAALLSFRSLSSGSVADLGSGAGLPGIILAVLRPACEVTLVESRRGKVVFLKRVVRELELGNVAIRHARIEDLAGEVHFDTAVARALDRPGDMLEHCLRLVAPSGVLVLYRGPRWAEEEATVAAGAAAHGFEIARTQDVRLPGVGRATTFVELRAR